MRIEVTGGQKDTHLTVPTRLIFSKMVLKLVLKNSRYASKLEELPPDAMDAIIEELQQIKKEKGSWLLFESESEDGEQIKISL